VQFVFGYLLSIGPTGGGNICYVLFILMWQLHRSMMTLWWLK